ncbi:hypothetical protein BB558_000981 [Smittium angustum]|uniref:DMAP1-binding domain-containing protein n=1 Tax=Smittium angustum TaxID=133377 RepID=A0A2U1JCX4_SMIAN|nr:hypothetical protein BB558_000981 [Smittium angustum]
MDINEKSSEYTAEYLEKLDRLIKDYELGYLTEEGYDKKKSQLTSHYNALLAAHRPDSAWSDSKQAHTTPLHKQQSNLNRTASIYSEHSEVGLTILNEDNLAKWSADPSRNSILSRGDSILARDSILSKGDSILSRGDSILLRESLAKQNSLLRPKNPKTPNRRKLVKKKVTNVSSLFGSFSDDSDNPDTSDNPQNSPANFYGSISSPTNSPNDDLGISQYKALHPIIKTLPKNPTHINTIEERSPTPPPIPPTTPTLQYSYKNFQKPSQNNSPQQPLNGDTQYNFLLPYESPDINQNINVDIKKYDSANKELVSESLDKILKKSSAAFNPENIFDFSYFQQSMSDFSNPTQSKNSLFITPPPTNPVIKQHTDSQEPPQRSLPPKMNHEITTNNPRYSILFDNYIQTPPPTKNTSTELTQKTPENKPQPPPQNTAATTHQPPNKDITFNNISFNSSSENLNPSIPSIKASSEISIEDIPNSKDSIDDLKTKTMSRIHEISLEDLLYTNEESSQFVPTKRNYLSSRVAKNQSTYFPLDTEIEVGANFPKDLVQNNIDFNPDKNPQYSSYPDNPIPKTPNEKKIDTNTPTINKRSTITKSRFYENSFEKLIAQSKSNQKSKILSKDSDLQNSIISPDINMPKPEPFSLKNKKSSSDNDLLVTHLNKKQQKSSDNIPPIHAFQDSPDIHFSNLQNKKTPKQKKSKNLVLMLKYRAKHNPNSVAYTCIDNKGIEIGNLTWNQVYLEANKTFLLLKKLPTNLTKGDRVALVYRKYEILDFICSLFGCFIGGLVAVPLVACDSYSELAYVLKSTGTKVVLTTDLNMKSLNKDLDILLSKNHPTTQNYQKNHYDGLDSPSINDGSFTSNNELDFNNIWPREIPWVCTSILGDLEKKSSNEKNTNALFSINYPEILHSDLAYIEYSKSGNGELKGVPISHGALAKQCSLWVISTGLINHNKLANSNKRKSKNQNTDSNFIYKHQNGSQNSGFNINNKIINHASTNNPSHNKNIALANSKSFLNKVAGTNVLKFGMKSKKSSIVGGDYVKIERASQSPTSLNTQNNVYLNDKANYNLDNTDSNIGGGIKISQKVVDMSLASDSEMESESNFNGSSDSEIDTDSEIEQNIGSYQNQKININFSFKNYKKEVILTNVEPRQQFGLLFGVFSGVVSGSRSIHLSSVICENPSAYLFAMSKYKANILATSGYKELEILLKTVIEDPTKIMNSNYGKIGIPNSNNLPNLSALRLVLVDTMEINVDFHKKFSSAVLMMFGCPVRKILREFNRPVLTPIATLPEYGGLLLAINTGNYLAKNGLDSFEENNLYSGTSTDRKIQNVVKIGTYDYDRDVSGINIINLDRTSIHHSKILVLNEKKTANSSASLDLPNSRNGINADLYKDVNNFSNSNSDIYEEKKPKILKMGMFGLPTLGSNIVIVDPDSRIVCDQDKIGEIWVDTNCAGFGFWGLPKLSASIFSAQFDYFVQPNSKFIKSSEKNQPTKLTSNQKYLRTGLMGAYINNQVMILGFYEDRLRCITKQKLDKNTSIADISVHYSLELTTFLKRKYSTNLHDCVFVEILSNNMHFIVLLVESEFLAGNSYSEISFTSWSSEIQNLLYNQFGLVLLSVAFCKPNSLPRAYQYGKRQINSILCRQLWELGKLKTYFAEIKTKHLFLGLPKDLSTISKQIEDYEPDPSIKFFGKWPQMTGYEQLDGCFDNSILDEKGNYMNLLNITSLTELLVLRADTNPKGIAYVQYNSKGNKVGSVTNLELLYKVSFVVLFLLDKLRLKSGD